MTKEFIENVAESYEVFDNASMAALLGMERSALEKTCLEAAKNGIVAPANYNSPGKIVIAGEKQAAEKALNLPRTQRS